MIVLGIALLINGFLSHVSSLWSIGAVILAFGVLFTVMGSLGHAVGGHRTYY